MQAGPDDVRIEMLGQFRIVLDDRQITVRDWPSRRAHELVALLALADGGTEGPGSNPLGRAAKGRG